MAECESDLETEGLELALDTLCGRHCSNQLSLKSKDYCSEFCELVEEYTGQWQVPLPQLKVLRTALCSFTKATDAFPEDCQHVHYVLSSMALSFFELMLFFSREEFVEEPLKDILDCFQQCHCQLLRHKNSYLQHVKLIIKAGGPWENPVLQGILKEAHFPPKQVEDYLSSELAVFFELRIRYLLACERMQEAMALAKSCLENFEAGKHLYFHQAYLTCLYKASLHEHLHKEMAEIDGRDAVEIICNTESMEKDELLLSLCKAFLTQQLHNGDMYYIWDLVFIWSRLHLRAHPSRHGFLAECLQLASSATNVRAIFPFIKLVTTELGVESVQTIAFLLPHDLEICRACALLVFCQERSLEAYRTVCLLYNHPDQEPHPQNSPVRTSVRFHILQMLKARLCFDPEFWNLLTIRTHCLELISDNVMKAAVLSEMKEEEEKENREELFINKCINQSCSPGLNPCRCTEAAETAVVSRDLPEVQAVAEREYLARCVKSQILKRKGRKKRWLQGLPRLEQLQTVKKTTVKVKEKVIYKGKKRGRKPLQKVELSYPDNEISRKEEESGFEEITDTEDKEPGMPHLENELDQTSKQEENQFEQMDDLQRENGLEKLPDSDFKSILDELTQKESQTQLCLPVEPQAAAPAVEADPELDGPPLYLIDCPIEALHSYSLKSKKPDEEKPPESSAPDEVNGNTEEEPKPKEETDTEVKSKRSWKDRMLRTQQYAHLMYHCNFCHKDYKGLNVMRHALSHLKSRKLKCILCGKRFKQLPFAKKHVMDHIDEMSKQKKRSTEDAPAANGVADHVDNQHQDKNTTSISNEETPEPKPAGKCKVSSLKREDRIIRNLRTLIKKTAVLHKKCKNPDANIYRQVDFKDEQVVIQDGLVIVKDPSTCDRVFLRVSSTLTKHAIKCHISEEKVLEKTFVWAKHKCSICLRQIQFVQHYKDHMKLHDTTLQHFCYHQDCEQRFPSQQELKDHVITHKPFRPQCPFSDCEKLFSSITGLHEHEWRHYIPAPQKDELEMGPGRQMQQSAEAPWKQRVKVEELWLQSKKGQREEASNVEGSREIQTEGQHCKTNFPDGYQPDNCPEKTVSPEPMCNTKSTINGHEQETKRTEGKTSTCPTGSGGATPKKSRRKRVPVEVDPLNVKDLEDLTTLSEGVQQAIGEPHITEHKTFKPEDPAYATSVKAPFIRPPPSTYLDEARLSMRKRRAPEEVVPKKNTYWNIKKNKEEQQVEEDVQKVRQRCDKCLSSFSSVEELQKHQALNTCSALFGFDSDDESK
ncbi:Zinc finger protein 292 [Dissostichus eleginoides]|uniref:Zinc finger protein 292 n=1 Tax=Dissostichus eleginoides TaxID=100907 RepID=A0AAD9CI60_DISEL|nr:Zinc finger protein 292 [Dissostichus eleginoides]